MLPPDWKNEIKNAIDEAAQRSNENRKREADLQNAEIAAPLNSLNDQFKGYVEKQERADQGKRSREIATIIGLFLTAAFALAQGIIFYLQYRELHRTDVTLRDTLEASTRAYVAITGIKWDGAPEVGKNQRIKILFKNVGKEPASNFSLFAMVSNQFDFEPDSKGMPYVPLDKVAWPIVECSGVNLSGQRVIGQRPVYPDVPNEAIWYAFNPGGSTPGAVFVPQRLLDGKTTIWVAGCAVYRSLDKWRHSPFCYYFQPARGGDVNAGTFEWCPVGAGNAD